MSTTDKPVTAVLRQEIAAEHERGSDITYVALSPELFSRYKAECEEAGIHCAAMPSPGPQSTLDGVPVCWEEMLPSEYAEIRRTFKVAK